MNLYTSQFRPIFIKQVLMRDFRDACCESCQLHPPDPAAATPGLEQIYLNVVIFRVQILKGVLVVKSEKLRLKSSSTWFVYTHHHHSQQQTKPFLRDARKPLKCVG